MAARKMPRADHILSYARTLGEGGVERALLRLARGWIADGRRVTIVVGDPSDAPPATVPDGVDLVTLGSPWMVALRALPRITARERPDVIFCPGSHYTSTAAWTKLRLRDTMPPIVGKISNALRRGDHHPVIDAGHRVWLRQHPRFLDAIVAMSKASAAEARAIMGERANVTVIPNPPAEPISGACFPDLPPRFILGVGRLVRQKRWDRLVAAAARLKTPLVIAGEGEEHATLAKQARVLGVDLRLPGQIADPLGLMARAAVVALTSDFEGVPGVLREALSVGTPVVTTDSSPAVREIVTAPTLGTIVARGDETALVAAIRPWLATDAVRPEPITPPGGDAAARYLALFDALMPA